MNIKNTQPILGFLLLLGGVFASTPSWATDYSGVSCNDKNVRRNLIELFDEADGDENAIDTYDQVTIQAGKEILVCEGIYELLDNSE